MQSIRLFFLLVGLVVFLPVNAQEEPQTRPAGAQHQPVAAGDPAPEFTLKAHDGAVHRLGDLRGRRNLVLVFFRGTW